VSCLLPTARISQPLTKHSSTAADGGEKTFARVQLGLPRYCLPCSPARSLFAESDEEQSETICNKTTRSVRRTHRVHEQKLLLQNKKMRRCINPRNTTGTERAEARRCLDEWNAEIARQTVLKLAGRGGEERADSGVEALAQVRVLSDLVGIQEVQHQPHQRERKCRQMISFELSRAECGPPAGPVLVVMPRSAGRGHVESGTRIKEQKRNGNVLHRTRCRAIRLQTASAFIFPTGAARNDHIRRVPALGSGPNLGTDTRLCAVTQKTISQELLTAPGTTAAERGRHRAARLIDNLRQSDRAGTVQKTAGRRNCCAHAEGTGQGTRNQTKEARIQGRIQETHRRVDCVTETLETR
jgi:hypothetical protein